MHFILRQTDPHTRRKTIFVPDFSPGYIFGDFLLTTERILVYYQESVLTTERKKGFFRFDQFEKECDLRGRKISLVCVYIHNVFQCSEKELFVKPQFPLDSTVLCVFR